MSSQNVSRLDAALERALIKREELGLDASDLVHASSYAAPDFFSIDYLSVTTQPAIRAAFLENIAKEPRVLGSGGSRRMYGNSPLYVKLEQRLRQHFDAETVLLCNTGYDANLSFWQSVPQAGDVILLDELAHTSIRDGINLSRCREAQYAFAHNDAASLRDVLQQVLKKHPSITAGKATVFVAVETLYSMDGDFCPLRQVIEVVEEVVPKGAAHIMVDEAHSSALFPGSRGLVCHLGLHKRVHTIMHSFSKGWGMLGGVLLTTPMVRRYVVNYARAFGYSVALPHPQAVGINAIMDYLTSPVGQQHDGRLRANCAYFERALKAAFRAYPPEVLRLGPRTIPADFPATVYSPIFPVLTAGSKQLTNYLIARGYAATEIAFPVVPRGLQRVRLAVHAGNSEPEMDEVIAHILRWADGFIAERKAAGAKL
ncbi:PLP-dependent transferase [Epithele typhae]|uniref:PLP-dependent transferase n=1 Tax=Epithele typhae TaxID=378194 RepID=UPI0020081E46|nr:PLP-dependent transferase [Epithele typhae]KAH9940169.1 PLP-dependent transferase [Epithele typhae]